MSIATTSVQSPPTFWWLEYLGWRRWTCLIPSWRQSSSLRSTGWWRTEDVPDWERSTLVEIIVVVPSLKTSKTELDLMSLSLFMIGNLCMYSLIFFLHLLQKPLELRQEEKWLIFKYKLFTKYWMNGKFDLERWNIKLNTEKLMPAPPLYLIYIFDIFFNNHLKSFRQKEKSLKFTLIVFTRRKWKVITHRGSFYFVSVVIIFFLHCHVVTWLRAINLLI